MNALLNGMKQSANVCRTENGGASYKSTMNGLMDLFALGGAYRSRTEEDVILLFDTAFKEDEVYALKCLFYLRDVRGGQGERRFFRTVCKWLAKNHTEAMRRNLIYVPEFGRWDDLYIFVGTPLEVEALDTMKHQFALDLESKTPSLLAKWLKSENTSSVESQKLGKLTRKHFGLTARQYRKSLSMLRERINVVERLMSAGRWDEIEFDKIPSKAGLIYRNAFARRDMIKAKYESFAKSTETKVNAGTLYPCDVVKQARELMMPNYWSSRKVAMDDTERLMLNKYWNNLTDYFNGATFNGVAVVDTSGSMTSNYGTSVAPIDVAVALGLYCADKCGASSPFYNHYITFSRTARLVETAGVDFCDKVKRITAANLCDNTNIESVFNLLINTIKQNNVLAADIPENVVIISDMEFDYCTEYGIRAYQKSNYQSDLERLAERFTRETGYECPKLIFWNVSARNDRIPMQDNGRVTFVSGYSPVIFDMVMTGKTGIDLVKEKLNSPRYSVIK